jgi:benzoate membrane transport protein
VRSSIVGSALVAVLVGFGGSVAIVLAAAQAVGATPAQSASWITAFCLSMGLTAPILSMRHRMPIVTAWSTPGAALIGATAVAGVPTIGIEAAVGAFILAALLVLLAAAVKPIAAAIARIPTAVAAGMLAGVLLGFAVDVFDSAAAEPMLVLPLVALFLVMRLFSPAWAVIVVILAGVAWAIVLGRVTSLGGDLGFATLEWITPAFDPAVLIGLGLPLFLVSMASQNLPGFAVLKAAGYTPPTRSALAVTGAASLLTAPFGPHTTTLAAITASLCTGPDTHPNPEKRWPAGVLYGAFYLVLAGIGVTVVAGFAALPGALIATIAGLALIGPLTGALSTALGEETDRFAAVVTLSVTASGFTLFGVGAAFWGLLLGLATVGLSRFVKTRRDT